MDGLKKRLPNSESGIRFKRRNNRMKTPIIWAGIAIFSAFPLMAQQTGSSPSESSTPDVAAMQQQIGDLQDRIVWLEGKMRMLKNAPPAAAAPAEATSQPSAPRAPVSEMPVAAVTSTGEQIPTLGGAGGSAAKALNPDISVIGDFI